jgi:hypothetical protein
MRKVNIPAPSGCHNQTDPLPGNGLMKFATERPYADPEAAARKLIEIANSVEAVQDFKGSPDEYSAGLKLAIERGWLWLHESGTYVKFTPDGAELFA